MRTTSQLAWRFFALCLITVAAPAQPVTTVASLKSLPKALLQGTDGNLYGVDLSGGAAACQATFGSGNCGELFKLTLDGTFSTVYSFQPGPNNSFPNPISLIQGSDGNFYGETENGGSAICKCGTIFKVTPQGVETTLYEFDNLHGSAPQANLVEGNDGNFYGTTSQGGAGTNCFTATTGCGTVFQITPQGALTTLYSFNLTDGATPGALIKGADGNLYGTASYGGPGGQCPGYPTLTLKGCGLVFKITPAGSLTTVYAFQDSTDGLSPSVLIQAKDGNFYGLAESSNSALGSAFQLTPAGVLSNVIVFDGMNGAYPSALIQGTDGNFYGTSSGDSGVLENGVVTQPAVGGTLFQLSPAGTLLTLDNFCNVGCTEPFTNSGFSVLQASDGNLYGIANGANNDIILFRYNLVPPNTPAISAAGGVLNGASFQPGISPGAWITINGTNLSTKTDTWNNSIVKGALPTTLDGVGVSIGGQPAYIEYVSPTQINALAPNLPAGSVMVTVTNASGTSQAAMAQLSAETPAFFQWGTYAVATHQDYTYAVKNGTFAGTTTVPAKPGDVIILWGTGFGPTSPAAPAGMQTPSTATYNTATTVSVMVGGKTATAYGAALASGYAGLYQIAIQIPAGLANGDYPVVATIHGVSSPSTTMITVQQ